MQLVAKPLIRQMAHGLLSRDLQWLEVEAAGTAGTEGRPSNATAQKSIKIN